MATNKFQGCFNTLQIKTLIAEVTFTKTNIIYMYVIKLSLFKRNELIFPKIYLDIAVKSYKWESFV